MQTGRCFYCGSEDVEYLSDGTHYCCECGTQWGTPRNHYSQRASSRSSYSHQRYNQKVNSPEWRASMDHYRRIWQNGGPKYSEIPHSPVKLTADLFLWCVALTLFTAILFSLILGYIALPMFMFVFHLPYCENFICPHSFFFGWTELLTSISLMSIFFLPIWLYEEWYKKR